MKNIFRKYREYIMSDKERLETLIQGKLPVINGFDEIKGIVDFYNDAYENQDWESIFYKKFSKNNKYEIWELLSNFIKPLKQIKNTLNVEMENYNRNYQYFLNRFQHTLSNLRKSEDFDKKKNDKIVENNRMHDISTGIFSHEEARNGALFNTYIKGNKSQKTIKLETLLTDIYDQFFSYFYIKLEFLSSLGLKIYPQMNKKINSWIDKLNSLNKLPLGNSISKENYNIIMHVANYYKHQTHKPHFPEIEFLNDFINSLFKKLNENLNFMLFQIHLELYMMRLMVS